MGEVLNIFSCVYWPFGYLLWFAYSYPWISFFSIRFSFSQEFIRVLFTVAINPLLVNMVICKYIPQYNTRLLTVYGKFLQIKILKFLNDPICLFFLGSGFPSLFFNGLPKFLGYFKKFGRGISCFKFLQGYMCVILSKKKISSTSMVGSFFIPDTYIFAL